jgi:hypothetical protein
LPQKRSLALVSILQGVAAAEIINTLHLRDFRSRAIFEFFNTICHVRTFGKVRREAVPALLMPHYVLSLNQMRDLGEYLRAYVAYVSANLGWGKALRFVLVWLAGMFVPIAAGTLVQLPQWVAMTWMVGWALLGYIFAPYGMWKHHRAQIASSIQPNQKQPR